MSKQQEKTFVYKWQSPPFNDYGAVIVIEDLRPIAIKKYDRPFLVIEKDHKSESSFLEISPNNRLIYADHQVFTDNSCIESAIYPKKYEIVFNKFIADNILREFINGDALNYYSRFDTFANNLYTFPDGTYFSNKLFPIVCLNQQILDSIIINCCKYCQDYNKYVLTPISTTTTMEILSGDNDTYKC